MARKNLSKEKIIEATLSLIDEKGSSKDVNFREIARRLNCAHTSLYNFFESYNDILLSSITSIVGKMREQVIEKAKSVDEDYFIFKYLSAAFDFSMEHKGWYRFLWLDNFNRKLDEILVNYRRPEKLFAGEIFKLANGKITFEEAEQYQNILHSYYHGEIVKYLSGRSSIDNEKILKSKILENSMLILQRLLTPNNTL